MQEEARTTICKMLDTLQFGRTEPAVRFNAVSSGMAEEDIKVTLSAKKLPPTVMLPKVESPTDLEWVRTVCFKFHFYKNENFVKWWRCLKLII